MNISGKAQATLGAGAATVTYPTPSGVIGQAAKDRSVEVSASELTIMQKAQRLVANMHETLSVVKQAQSRFSHIDGNWDYAGLDPDVASNPVENSVEAQLAEAVRILNDVAAETCVLLSRINRAGQS